MQVTWKPMWIENSFFDFANPCSATIHAATVEEREGGRKDIVIELVSEKSHARMSVWGANLKFLIDKYGAETEAWVGKHVKISQTKIDGKTKRFLA